MKMSPGAMRSRPTCPMTSFTENMLSPTNAGMSNSLWLTRFPSRSETVPAKSLPSLTAGE